MVEKLFERRPDTTDDDASSSQKKLYLTQYGKDRIGALLKKLPPKTDLSEITGISISNQAYYNYIKYDKPLSRKGAEACEALDKYITLQESRKGVNLETAIKTIKQHGGKVTF
jgi:hypothetical protein